MPLVTIKLARRKQPTSRENKNTLITGITKLIAHTLGKRSEDVVVLIEEIDPDNWGQGGISATDLRMARKAMRRK